MAKRDLSSVIEELRERRGLEPNDSSQDYLINKYSPYTVVRELSAWNLGDPEWACEFLQWFKIAGFNLEEKIPLEPPNE